MYDFCEFLNILNGDDFLLRRRLLSMLLILYKIVENGLENYLLLIVGLDLVGLSLGVKNDVMVYL